MRRVDYHTVLTSVVCFAIATLRGTGVPEVSGSRCSRLRGGVSLWRARFGICRRCRSVILG